MPRDEQAMDNAEFVFYFEKFPDNTGYRDVNQRPTFRQLPWVGVKFKGAGESQDFVMPIPPHSIIMGSGINTPAGVAESALSAPVEGGTKLYYYYGRAFMEFVPNQPFPLDTSYGIVSPGTGSAGAGGTMAVHFFGGI